MLFYASLFLFCVVVSAVTLWMYRSLNAVGKAVYRAFLPSSRGSRELRGNEEREEPITYNDVPLPWGWSGDTRIRRVQRLEIAPVKHDEHSAVPWGWPGNDRNVPRLAPQNPVGNPIAWLSRSTRAQLSPHVAPDESEDEEPTPVGWPYRDEAFDFGGRTYRVTRTPARVSYTNIGNVVRPWGW